MAKGNIHNLLTAAITMDGVPVYVISIDQTNTTTNQQGYIRARVALSTTIYVDNTVRIT